jgi:hypothetical protein
LLVNVSCAVFRGEYGNVFKVWAYLCGGGGAAQRSSSASLLSKL